MIQQPAFTILIPDAVEPRDQPDLRGQERVRGGERGLPTCVRQHSGKFLLQLQRGKFASGGRAFLSSDKTGRDAWRRRRRRGKRSQRGEGGTPRTCGSSRPGTPRTCGSS